VAKACLGIDDVIFLAREPLGRRRLMMSGSDKQRQREKRMVSGRVFNLYPMALLHTVYGIRYSIILGISHTPHPHPLWPTWAERSILPTPLAEMSSVPNFDSIGT